jgi:hypothetical protein
MSVEFTQRLRELDQQVEGLRAALAALQRHLSTQQPATAATGPETGTPGDGASPAERDEYLRAYV